MIKLSDWNANVQVDKFYYLLFVLFIFLLTANYYNALIEHKTVYIINFFALVFSLKLSRVVNDSPDVVLKTQITQMMSLSILLLVLSFLPIPFWILVTLNNFFGIVYFGFFYFHQVRYKDAFKVVESYISISHTFFVIYLLLLNLQGYFFNNNTNDLVIMLGYVQVGLQYVLLVLSIFTYFFYNKQLKDRESETFFLAKDWNVEGPKELLLEEKKEVETEVYRLKYQNKELAGQILDFFDQEKVFLQCDFSLETLCQYIPRSSVQQASYVINNHLNTSFYKLVAFHRIIESLQLLKNKPDWTLLAVAEECGFKSVNTFNKYFKDLTGFSPTEYRVIIEKSKRKL